MGDDTAPMELLALEELLWTQQGGVAPATSHPEAAPPGAAQPPAASVTEIGIPRPRSDPGQGASTEENNTVTNTNLSGKRPRLPAADDENQKSTSKRAKKPRKPRKDFSLHEKIKILDELGQGGTFMKDICLKYGTNRESLRQWKAARPAMEAQMNSLKRGDMTRMHAKDGLRRVKEGMNEFYVKNRSMSDERRIPITGSILASKAIVIRNRLLASHAKTPFLADYEIQQLTSFKASDSWSRKMAAQFGWHLQHNEAGKAGSKWSWTPQDLAAFIRE